MIYKHIEQTDMLDISEIYTKLNKAEWMTPVSLKKLRMYQYKVSQKEFAAQLGVNFSTYVSWEQGRYTPSSPAMALLHVAKYYPGVFNANRKAILEKIAL